MSRTRCFRYWLALVICFTLQWQHLHGREKRATCHSVCNSMGIPNGCKYADSASDNLLEEVIVVTNGTSNIASWQWDTISMVVSDYFSSTRTTGYTACYTHSQGRRYGLRERVPSDIAELINDTDGSVKSKFGDMIVIYQNLLMADHIVYDLLDFFNNLQRDAGSNKSQALSKMTEVLLYATDSVRKSHDRESYCIVPWKPPCDEDCSAVNELLSHCHILLMSPDSYLPVASVDRPCMAQATVPISQFLYGIDRYISLRPNSASSIVAGIPWHGYAYKCDKPISDNKCVITKNPGEVCFSRDNRQRRSLTDIYMSNMVSTNIKMDVVTKAIYYNLNNSAQLWYENYTTLLIKYQLVQDLQLRGLSLWYGEDMTVGLSTQKAEFSHKFWGFLAHHVLHKAVYRPHTVSHYYADTVAGVGVGCLLLGTLLGTIFTCISFRHSRLRQLNRPFKLDEDENAFRDDEGL